VLDNGLGGIIGIGIYAALAGARGIRTHRVLNIVGVVLTAGALLLGAFLLANTLRGR
jgi:hypothetical protein